MVIIEGRTYYTTADAAKALGVSAKTIRSYIEKGIIPEPPEVQSGLRTFKHFPKDYMGEAKRILETYRQKQASLKRDKQLSIF
ncbi:MAG: MerR family DNA-binding transcriptional regulator [Deltaproteobacteria bacterium]|nr:MerR family DNA-binding transcriptional regulator [Deltaproteobacteria bacterium]